jgi:DEAD/DEAH box helicase domain-containing protein
MSVGFVHQVHDILTSFHVAALDLPLSHRISEAIFKARNVQSLYSHQASAINAIRRGRHVVVSTSTASGKSMIYQVLLSRSFSANNF